MRETRCLLGYGYMKKYLFIVLALVLEAPSAFAQSGGLNTAPIEDISASIIGILNTVVVPVVFAIAFIVFIWGVFQAFILNGANEEKRKEGAKFVLWSVIGFAVMISIWGLVNLFGSLFGNLDNRTPDFPTFGQVTQKAGTESQNKNGFETIIPNNDPAPAEVPPSSSNPLISI